jgi:hypothetical protein
MNGRHQSEERQISANTSEERAFRPISAAALTIARFLNELGTSAYRHPSHMMGRTTA